MRQELSNKYGKSIDEGIDHLNRVLAIDPDNTNAMSYLNLLIRERAALRTTQAESDQDIAQAERWMQQAVDTRQRLSPSPPSDVITAPVVPRLAAQPPAPAPAREASPFTGIRIGPDVAEANLTKKVRAIYPPLAKSTLVQGVVRFQVAIGKDGTIRAMRLMSGHPLLVQAAKEAVQQYVYRPTLLNGQPVDVVTEVDVNFSFSRGH